MRELRRQAVLRRRVSHVAETGQPLGDRRQGVAVDVMPSLTIELYRALRCKASMSTSDDAGM